MAFAWSNFSTATHESDSKMINSAKQKLRFTKFKLQIIKLLTKFAHQIKTDVVKTFAKSIYQSDIPLTKFSQILSKFSLKHSCKHIKNEI